ncbi:hypothetical protein niasHS_000252 [Heterodera schachtii]|uniref:Uncharacterized protein n=1 Tax=Heterodera schachtii TaxID=97005 RepID=A0ABD2KHK5_HETSC
MPSESDQKIAKEMSLILCAGRLLRQRERVVLSREDLNNVFVSRVSTDDRWNSPPVRTSPNFGHFSILEKNWDEKAKRRTHIPNVARQVSRKAGKLRQVEQQSRYTFDVLDFWVDWFNGVQEQIADKPAVDLEQLRQQLRQQNALNQEIVAKNNGLRDIVVEATKVVHELSSTLGGQDAMMAKVERSKRLADETMELGTERVAKLKQDFVLCKEFAAEYTELNEWMCLLAQQHHNNADKPAVDLEQLRQQLRQQNALNQEIVAKNNGLRDIVVEATKVVHELSSTLGGQDAMMAKVERSKRLADETMELGTERVAKLKQDFVLCKEFAAEYTELNEWMCLLAQQHHNNADKPAVDLEQLRQQLRQQNALNQEIVAKNNGLRDIVVEATKVVHELSSTLGGQDAMMAKVERSKRLADEKMELGTERVAKLKQDFVLCKEFAAEYTELNEWMCLLAQQHHNNCAGRLLRQRERVVLSREDLNNVFVSRFSTDDRWNSPPVRTSPNFGHFSILEKNWDEKAKRRTHIPNVARQVSRKAGQLRQVEQQSRHPFDVLDFWVDWFNGVQEQIADKPAVDLEQLRQQLRQQNALNQEIVAKNNGLRDIVVEATKVVHELSSTLGGQDAMMAKVERSKRLADETMELGTERVAKLKQDFVLCKEFAAEYTELNEWMCLLAQQHHNNADKPAVDLEQLRQQLRQQNALNQEIVAKNNGLRDIVVEATKVVHELSSTLGGQDAMMAKVERSKRLADETMELGTERVAKLKQDFVLCKEFAAEYTELNEWMCLLAQQHHNNCAGRLLRQRERVVLSREDLNNVFVSRVSTDDRWNSPPVRTSPNFGHFSILEKNWDEKAKRRTHIPNVARQVSRKAGQLRQVEQQSRHTFDVLDFWVDWFNGVQEQIADKPAVDLEQLRQQLRQQNALNQEIVAKNNGLRDIVVEATKVVHELSSTLGGQDAMMAKVERSKRLADETMELGTERVAKLKQDFVLCKEFAAEYTELNEWMCLLAQQHHNNADKPAVDLEQLRQQLRQQNALNQEIVAKNNGLRDIVVEATKVVHELSSTLGGQDAMMAKVERSKRLADETMELGTERVAKLKQVNATS